MWANVAETPSGVDMPTLAISIMRPQSMEEARFIFLKGFEGRFVPIYHSASVRQDGGASVIFMLVKQDGTSGRVSSNLKHFPSPKDSITVCNPDFFVEGSTPPQPKGNKVPKGSPMVKVRMEVKKANGAVTAEVIVDAATSITPLLLSRPVVSWRFDAAGWAAAVREATALTYEQNGRPATFWLRQFFKDYSDLRNSGKEQPPSKPMLTHEQLGSRSMLRLALSGPGLGMQQGATGEFTFVGEYVPISIFASALKVTTVMIKRNGLTPVRDTPMIEHALSGGRMLYHPDFFYPPVVGGNATPREKPVIRARAPVVSIVRNLTQNAQSVLSFGRFQSGQIVPVTALAVPAIARTFTIKIEWLHFTGAWIR